MKNDTAWPPRIRNAFIGLQYQSEFIVASVQLGIITLLNIIIIMTPIGYSPDAPLRSAVLGLSLFTILVLLRLWFVYTNNLNNTIMGFFVIAEMALLLFIIWTYHIQFESPSEINLKNSHLNYVYVLIALRALRFEPIWVLLSGITAILGWFFIVFEAILSAGLQAITWDYVTYAQSQKIYFGAEFDKFITIMLVTLILTFAIMRAKETLRQSVLQTCAAKDLSLFFDSQVAEKITHAHQTLSVGQGETREAAILFIDLRGFSRLSESMLSSDLIKLLGEYQKILVPIIQKYHGNIDKFMGDGILASFGAVTPSVTYAKDAVDAVDEIVNAVKNLSVRIGMGLAVGEIVFGVIGFENRLEYTIIGEAVNIAAKLEKYNKIEKVQALATIQVLEKAIQQGYQDLHPKEIRLQRTVAGIEEKLDLVVLAF